MPEVNLPEEYYQAHGFTRLKAGSGPHLGHDADLSFDVVEKTEIISAQPVVSNGKLTCYQRTKLTRHLFTWRYDPATRKFSLVSDKVINVVYGPLIPVPCPPALKDQFERVPDPVDISRLNPCPDEDTHGTNGRLPDEFYADFFKDRTVRIVQRIETNESQTDFLDVDGFVYAKTEMESGDRCFRRYRHIKARLIWTFCPRTGIWHLQSMDFYVNLWGPWEEIPCHEIPGDTIVLSTISD